MDDWRKGGILKRTLVKIGGSLLQRPDIVGRVLNLMERVNGVLLVGGGEAADLVRLWDGRFQLKCAASHRLAIEAMRMNALLLTELNERFVFVDDVHQLSDLSEKIAVLDPVRSLQQCEARLSTNQLLPESWHVTSDSIAAWLSLHLNFDELLLVKSVDLPAMNSEKHVATLQANGLIDVHFHHLADCIQQLSWCNLISDAPATISRVW